MNTKSKKGNKKDEYDMNSWAFRLGYTNDLKIYLKRYDRLYLFYYTIESIKILVSLGYEYILYKKIKIK